MLTLKYLQNLSGTILLAGFDNAKKRHQSTNRHSVWQKTGWLSYVVSLAASDENKKIDELYKQLQKAKAGDTNYREYIYDCVESYLEKNPKDLFSKILYSEISKLACCKTQHSNLQSVFICRN